MKTLLSLLVLFIATTANAQSRFDDPWSRLDPSERLVVQLSPLGRAAAVSAEYGHGRALSVESREALALTPLWIQPALFDTLTRLDPMAERAMAQTILVAHDEDPRYVDEVAFSIAHLPLEDLLYDSATYHTQFDPELLLENVRHIYGAEASLGFARLVEHEEDPENPFTTVALTMAEGEWEAPRDFYYWYVAHPRLADDSALYVNPRTGNPALALEEGRFWRSMILSDAPDPDYTYPVTLKAPELVSDPAGYMGDGGIAIPDADAIVELEGPGGEPLLIHYARGQGMVYATTLEVERTPSALATNLVAAGFGPGSVILPMHNMEFLLIRDRAPFGANVLEQALLDGGYSFTVWDATTLGTLTSADELSGFKKIIVAGDQPHGLYTTLESKADLIEEWLDTYSARVLLFSGGVDATHQADDWSGLALPMLFERVNQGALISGAPRGYPTFNEVIALPPEAAGNYVWDGNSYNNLSGQRFFGDSDMVLDRLGYLVSQTLELRVGEIPPEYSGPDGNCPSCGVVRSPWPQRILYQHYGNCGELQDAGMAFGRTALLPSAGVGGITEDHVWNEFYLNDTWVPFQVSWSDSGTFIAVPGNIQDKDYGGGKDLAIVYRTRPDGKWENVTERYSNTFNVTFRVHDALGAPVSGAEVLLASENWYDASQLNVALITHTDHMGEATLALGDYQNFYVRVSSGAGSWPDAESVQWIVCADPDATNPGGAPCPATAPWDEERPMITGDASGVNHDIEITLEGTLPQPPTVAIAPPLTDDERSEARAKVVWNYNPQAMRSIHAETGGASFTDYWEFAEAPQAWLFDKPNLELWLAGEDATAVALLTADGTPQELPLPGSMPYFIGVAGAGTWGSSTYIALSVSVEDYSFSSEEELTSSGSGCGCKSAGDPALPPPLWITPLFLLIVVTRRRLRGALGER